MTTARVAPEPQTMAKTTKKEPEYIVKIREASAASTVEGAGRVVQERFWQLPTLFFVMLSAPCGVFLYFFLSSVAQGDDFWMRMMWMGLFVIWYILYLILTALVGPISLHLRRLVSCYRWSPTAAFALIQKARPYCVITGKIIRVGCCRGKREGGWVKVGVLGAVHDMTPELPPTSNLFERFLLIRLRIYLCPVYGESVDADVNHILKDFKQSFITKAKRFEIPKAERPGDRDDFTVQWKLKELAPSLIRGARLSYESRRVPVLMLYNEGKNGGPTSPLLSLPVALLMWILCLDFPYRLFLEVFCTGRLDVEVIKKVHKISDENGRFHIRFIDSHHRFEKAYTVIEYMDMYDD